MNDEELWLQARLALTQLLWRTRRRERRAADDAGGAEIVPLAVTSSSFLSSSSLPPRLPMSPAVRTAIDTALVLLTATFGLHPMVHVHARAFTPLLQFSAPIGSGSSASSSSLRPSAPSSSSSTSSSSLSVVATRKHKKKQKQKAKQRRQDAFKALRKFVLYLGLVVVGFVFLLESNRLTIAVCKFCFLHDRCRYSVDVAAATDGSVICSYVCFVSCGGGGGVASARANAITPRSNARYNAHERWVLNVIVYFFLFAFFPLKCL